MNQIRCESIDQLVQIIDGLVRAGLTFRADASTLERAIANVDALEAAP